MKIVADIERIGDNGVNMARRALEIMHEPELKPIIDIPVAAAAAQRILKESLDAFVNSDADLAKRVIQDDRYIDDVCEQMLRELLTYMFEDPSTVSRALRLMFVARNLERIGDHAANIAEMVIFLVEGQDVRHRQAAKAQAGGQPIAAERRDTLQGGTSASQKPGGAPLLGTTSQHLRAILTRAADGAAVPSSHHAAG